MRILLLAGFLALTALPVRAITLYSTEFEEFATGYDKWAGANGWLGTSTGVGAHGIDQDILPGLGKTAFIGFNRPKQTFVSVFRPILYNPVTNGMPVVEFETLMGINDSTNGFRDSFFFTFYNSSGYLLGSVRFDNTDVSFGIWRLDGTNQYDTGVEFIRSELHLLYTSINFSNNTWSADLDGIPLFTGVQFNATGQARDLGYIAAEWQLTSASTNEYGNNWMLVADWYVSADAPVVIDGVSPGSNGFPVLKWAATKGFKYAVEYADEMKLWTSGLPNSVFSNIAAPTTLTFTESTNASRRAYRIRRTAAP
jgi:hypothetical protein